MKNTFTKFLTLALVAAFILGSCARSNSVVSNHRLQKRKYTSGFHLDKNNKLRTVKDDKIEKEPLAIVETEITISSKEYPVESPSFEQTVDLINLDNPKVEEVISEETSSNSEVLEKPSSPLMEVKEKRETKAERTVMKSANHRIAKKSESKKSTDIEPIIYILLCIFIPFVAVGLATDWDVKDVVITILLSILFWLPGIIYAFYVCDREGVL